MRRVLHVFANLNLGGAESRILDIYRKLPKDKYQFDFVIMTKEKCHFEDEVISLGGRVFRVTHPNQSIIRHFYQLLSLCKENKFHAIHSHVSYLSGVVLFISKIGGVRYRVAHARNKSINSDSFPRRLMFHIGKYLINKCATSKLSISDDSGKFLYGENSKYRIVPNAFDFSKIKFRDSHKDESEFRVVMLARLVQVKNHAFAIQLLKRLNRLEDDVFLDLIGDGSLAKQLQLDVKKHGLEDRVRFLGKRTDVHLRLKSYDCLILPSLSEGLGVAALEGQVAGIPCLVSNRVPKDVDLNISLLKHLPLDIDVWLDEMLKLKSDKLKNVVLPTRNEVISSLVEKGYDIDRTMNIYLCCYGLSNE